jgi:hypothetical protein
MSLEQKYLKYKQKYLELKKQIGGECDTKPIKEYQDPINMHNLLKNRPIDRITINKNCYDVIEIYKWVIEQNNTTDPLRILVSPEDRQRIIDTYNIAMTVTAADRSVETLNYANLLNPYYQKDYVNSHLRLKLDTEITKKFLKRDSFGVKNVPLDILMKDKNYKNIERLAGQGLLFVPDILKSDEEIVTFAVNLNGLALQFASVELRNNERIVRTAVLQNGLALQFASDEQKNTPLIVLDAILQNRLALQYASPSLQNNETLKNIITKCNI